MYSPGAIVFSRESASANTLSFPGMCITLNWILNRAAVSHRACKHALRKVSLVFPVWATVTAPKLSQNIQTTLFCHLRAHTFRATVILYIS